MTGTDLTSAAEDSCRGPTEIVLRVWHASADPQLISEALNLQPTLFYKAGEPRVTPRGRTLDSVHRETLWSYDLAVSPGSSVADAVAALDNLLISRYVEIQRLKSEGARFEYFVGLFLDSDRVEILDSKLMLRCAEKGIDLVLSIYVPRIDSTGVDL